jgi:ribonuclease P protein component
MRRGSVANTRHLILFTLAPPRWAARTSRANDGGAEQHARTRVGIVITKKVGAAVERNRLRRRCKALLDALPMPDPPMWYVVQFRPSAAAASFAQLRDALDAALRGGSRPAGRRRRSVEAKSA